MNPVFRNVFDIPFSHVFEHGKFDPALGFDLSSALPAGITFTAPTEEVGFEPELMWYRVGVKAGEFTASDDINIRLGREDKDRH